MIFYVNGETHIGFYLKDINKYVTNVNRWKDIDSSIWFDDDEVEGWDPYFS
ncbi:MAG: hypothetical protein J6U54_10975 [Clostridiales bacterium]|nr:hypothetical protein [Clostridiales bacterium]